MDQSLTTTNSFIHFCHYFKGRLGRFVGWAWAVNGWFGVRAWVGRFVGWVGGPSRLTSGSRVGPAVQGCGPGLGLFLQALEPHRSERLWAGPQPGRFSAGLAWPALFATSSSQQSSETPSHWYIFHMYKARQVVETWDRQFHCAPREQRVFFLYLANDILQNSRRKGAEYVAELWKVLPDSLRDVIANGDESGKNCFLIYCRRTVKNIPKYAPCTILH